MTAMRVKLIHAVAILLPLAMGGPAQAQDPIEAKAKVCAACHGENGIPQLKTTPVIWGQNTGYMLLQLRDFQSGARKNDLMSPIAATRAESFATREPSPRPVVPASPVRVTIFERRWPMDARQVPGQHTRSRSARQDHTIAAAIEVS